MAKYFFLLTVIYFLPVSSLYSQQTGTHRILELTTANVKDYAESKAMVLAKDLNLSPIQYEQIFLVNCDYYRKIAESRKGSGSPDKFTKLFADLHREIARLLTEDQRRQYAINVNNAKVKYNQNSKSLRS